MNRRSAFVLRAFIGVALALGFPLFAARSALAEPSQTLTVLAAASLREAFSRIGPQFEAAHPGVKVTFAFAGTQELRVQLEHGAKADVFAAADTKHTTALAAAGLIGAPVLFAQNRLIVIVPRTNPAGLRQFAHQPRARRLVVGATEVPIGAYTAMALTKAAITLGSKFSADVEARIVSRELNVKQIVAKVTLGEADAAVVYETDARAAATKVEAIAIPAEFNVTADYPVAVVRPAPQAALAQTFVEALTAAPAQQELRALGFLAPARSAARAREAKSKPASQAR
jgi:molybdate transport system substrate-binding protein